MEKKIGKPWCLSDPWSRMVKATGISLSTLKSKIEALDPVQDVVETVHKSSVQKPGPKPWKLNDFNRNVVKRTIYDMYRKKEVVSMPRLHEVLKEKDITASLSTVVRTVKSLGFREKADRLLGNNTTNLAESLMHIRCKFDGGKLYNLCNRGSWHGRCFGGGLRMNFGPEWSPKVWQKTTATQPGFYFT
ncbi:unnamed protein product [Mytilus coruscus]|uniref:Uncharacterized protein n=1 Tax=Mytilus coruscus TaxID=42192 RepID=A0A6J8DZU5_MYTCO|nr:unnamed protein product [Mytilus coruscus]